jgi:hypothetical protein
MDKYVKLPDTDEGDNGGVHINSGIPNKAFFLVATTIGGYSWEAPGHIWYEALRASHAQSQFQDFADTTYHKAGELYGDGGTQQKAVLDAWGGVGIQITGVATEPEPETPIAALSRQIEALSTQVQSLAVDVRELKDKS